MPRRRVEPWHVEAERVIFNAYDSLGSDKGVVLDYEKRKSLRTRIERVEDLLERNKRSKEYWETRVRCNSYLEKIRSRMNSS